MPFQLVGQQGDLLGERPQLVVAIRRAGLAAVRAAATAVMSVVVVVVTVVVVVVVVVIVMVPVARAPVVVQGVAQGMAHTALEIPGAVKGVIDEILRRVDHAAQGVAD
ncbi:hypothetical protein [Streptomyces sp. SID9727]|uniref:hypothetical protein n=1 Tax=Streptomyces sp. SID9727 TaxID=2706114 RepID=UPI0013C99F49|nr:hypothetical protein [Streptomyces sp. SID9727]NEC67595.1 hypothetical protein [Streptomyces sp. SID9727]